MHRARAARAVVAVAAAAATALPAAACTGSAPSATSAGRERSGEPPVGIPAELPESTTHTTVHGAPRDRAAHAAAATDGLVVRATTDRTVLDAPGGRPIATLPARQLGGPTWVPVVSRSGAWLQVLLPSRPNQATGWISTAEGGLRTARTPYLVRVDVPRRRLSLLRSGRTVGRWRVAVGAPATPTPIGRTFLLALLRPSQRTPSPLLMPLGAHSATLDTYGGGPGTVALHGWPDRTVFGRAVTHGCVRVPKDALRALSKVPLGTLVIITG
ncbi:L,D-transpeptidase [Actinomadura rugatobispora]|uniref:L,D-transpeptidase n=1 Tax=Actinomadura rugatobispora TaxID=1994 RepID=A0ABW1AJ93_9ACTN